MEPLRESIPSVVRGLLRSAPMSPGKLQAAWRLAVGPAIHRATRVGLRDDGTLEVASPELTWRREVKRSQELILSRLQGLLGPEPVRKVKVVTELSEAATRSSREAEDSAG